MSERAGYREILHDILEFSDGRRLLTLTEVRNYTGLRDNRTVKRRFPVQDGYVAAPMLARCLAGGETR